MASGLFYPEQLLHRIFKAMRFQDWTAKIGLLEKPARSHSFALESNGELSRAIGWRTAAAVVIANMIGTGIFTTSGFIARDTGSPWILLTLWVVGGLIALAGAWAYAELGAAMPEAGGEYVFLREAYGGVAAFLSGWTSFFAGFSGAIAAAVLAFAGYIAAILPLLGNLDARLLAITTLWTLTAVHLAGARPGGRFQTALTGATVTTIVALIISGFVIGHGTGAHFLSSAPPHGSIAVSLIFVLYAYSGWNAAAYLAGEIAEPERGLPRALTAGTACVAGLYLALNALYVWALPIAEMSGVVTVAAKATVAMFGPAASGIVAALIALAILSSASAMIMAGPRVYFAMAQDGVFPRAFAMSRHRSGPSAAVFLQSAWITVLILVFGVFEKIIVFTGVSITIFSAATVAAVIPLRIRTPSPVRPFTMPGYPWTALAYVAVCTWIVTYAAITRSEETILGIAAVLGGLPIFWLLSLSAKEPGTR
jgi:APA family basic amino acid/polyamine antiporter